MCLALLLVSACGLKSVPLPAKVGVDLVSAASTAQHRVLVFRACSDGVCFSDSYLQWLDGHPPKVVHTSRIEAFGQGSIVRSVRWTQQAGRSALMAIVDTRHPGAAPGTVFVIPAEPGVYRVER